MSQTVRFQQLILAGLLSACVTQNPRATPPTVSPSPSAPTSADSTRTSAKSELGIYQPGNVRYALQLKSVVQTAIEDSVPRVDSSRLTAILSAKYSPVPQSRLVHALMVSDSVTLSALATTITPPVVLPNQSYSMDIDPSSGKITVSRAVQACSQESVEGPFHGDEITPAVPSNGARFWADTAIYSGCRGGVLLRFARVSTYQRDTVATSAAGEPFTRVYRTVDVTVTGTGSQWQQAVEATGHGTAADTLVIRTAPAQLQSISGSGRLELFFKSALRSQHFVQTTTSQVTAQPSTR
jgi:hypothetical protein